MNKTSTQANGRNTFQNLRSRKEQTKPLHIALFATVQNAVSFVVRSMNCDAASHMLATKSTGEGKVEIQKLDDFGKWTKAA